MTKGTRVTEREKQKMWELYQQYGSIAKVAKKTRRCPSTVSKYVHEKETLCAAGYLLKNK